MDFLNYKVKAAWTRIRMSIETTYPSIIIKEWPTAISIRHGYQPTRILIQESKDHTRLKAQFSVDLTETTSKENNIEFSALPEQALTLQQAVLLMLAIKQPEVNGKEDTKNTEKDLQGGKNGNLQERPQKKARKESIHQEGKA